MVSPYRSREILVLAAFAVITCSTGFASAQQQRDENAIPASQAGKLPTTQERYRSLKTQIEKTKPGVESARQKSQRLQSEAASLRRKLIATAARVQALETEKTRLDADIVRLAHDERTMSAGFARDRVQVSHLLAVLQRLQLDMPPAIALEPNDALAASRGAMVLGASLPRLYGAAAALAKRLEALRRTQAALVVRRAEDARNAVKLGSARRDLDQLLAIREREAATATGTYAALQTQFDVIAREAADLETLLERVAALRTGAPQRGMVVVTADNGPRSEAPARGSLLRPVVGEIVKGSAEGAADRAPGLTFFTPAGAAVVAPADCQVLFAGRYHKTGQVLILEISGGYDLVLAGLDRIEVRPGDRLLAGEPLGRMALASDGARLYFEVRQNGRGVSPAPWLGIDLRKAKKS